MLTRVDRIERVSLRDIWPHEEASFTPWLLENLDILEDTLSIGLTEAKREQSAGAFSVDLVAQGSRGETVIIENQLGKSDHDHLGKLLTYLTALDAKTAIWVVGEARPEHLAAVSWLNQSPDVSFYMVKLEAVRIGDSLPAPLLTLLVGPSPEARVVGQTRRERTEAQQRYYRFWEKLLERATQRTDAALLASQSARSGFLLPVPTGVYPLTLYLVVRKTDASVRLDIGSFDQELNQRIFSQLEAAREAIERDFGQPLEWQAGDGKVFCTIETKLDCAGLDDEEQWPQTQDTMITALHRFEAALRPHLDHLDA